MKSTITIITPNQAVEMMARSKTAGALNRMTKAKLRRLVRDIQSGGWELNGEPIIVSITGRILDGHHRLEACRLANVAIETVLITEAPDKVINTIDTGSSRSIADTLHLAGHKGRAAMLSALGKAVGYLITAEEHGNPLHSAQPPSHIIEKWLQQHIDLEEKCLQRTEKLSKVMPAAPRPLIAYLYIIGMIANPNVTEEFFDRLVTGFAITEGDPAGAMRQFFLLDVPAKNKAGRRQLNNTDLLARMIKALDASLRGETIEKLTWSAKKDAFPVITPPAAVMADDESPSAMPLSPPIPPQVNNLSQGEASV